jgi:hypothetical protein
MDKLPLKHLAELLAIAIVLFALHSVFEAIEIW